MNATRSKVSLVLSLVACALAVTSVCLHFLGDRKVEAEVPEQQEDIQYVLYLGTNDKDTNEPVFEPEEAKETLKEMLNSRFGGYTIQEANGGWIDDDGTEYQEYTLVIYLSDTNIDDVHALCNDLIKEYNQSSVLIQANTTKTEFYAGE